jgi:sugar-specific transcriptional regulator TrmB
MITELKNLGLSDNEAKVYAAMLELGPSSVLEISAKAGVNRPTTYVQIESLKKKGLVSTQTKGSKQVLIPESPEHLQDMLDSQIHAIGGQKEILSKVLPDLLSLYQSLGTRPQVRFFEGTEGLLRMQDIFLKSGHKEVLAIESLDDIFRIFPKHQDTYSSRRVKNKIHSKLIYSSSQGPILKANDEAMLRETRFIPVEKMPFSGDVVIYGSSVAITSLRGKISAVLIEHHDIAESFRGFFKFLWEFASQSSDQK